MIDPIPNKNGDQKITMEIDNSNRIRITIKINHTVVEEAINKEVEEIITEEMVVEQITIIKTKEVITKVVIVEEEVVTLNSTNKRKTLES